MSKVDHNNDITHIQISHMKRSLVAQLATLDEFACSWCEAIPSKLSTVKGKSKNYRACVNCVGTKQIVETVEQKSEDIVNASITVALPILQECEVKMKKWREDNMSEEEQQKITARDSERKKKLEAIANDLDF